MAIQNASDLLVYAKTASAVAQVTRIRVLTTAPLIHAEGTTSGTIKINNITNNSGVVSDDLSTAAIGANTGSNVLAKIGTVLSTNNNYLQSAESTDGDYTYRDYTNGAVGLVPTLKFVNGTSEIKDNAITIEIVTPGSSAIFDPVAFSTSASFSTNMDLRDVTNKDSDGWSESLGGLRSFEVSTDILQSINPDVPLDGTDFFDKLQARSLVDLSFSDRIRNIIRTNLTQSGVDGFGLATATQINLQTDPFSGSRASKITAATTSYNNLRYTVDSTRLEGKDVTWTFYAKGVGSNTSVSFFSEMPSISSIAPDKVEVLSGTYTTITSPTTNGRAVNGLSTSSFTRIQVTYNNLSLSSSSTFRFMAFPGDDPTSQIVGDSVIVSSWQIELSPEATNYQDPTEITHWQGNALVSSVSFDAGVEDNLTCSATFTGTGNIYPNGLGPELIGDTAFDDPSYWSVFPSDESLSVVENGYGKIITNASNDESYISKSSLITVGDYYLLEYTVAVSTVGGLTITDGWDSDTDPDVPIVSTVGTHKVLLKPATTGLFIKRTTANNNVWLSSISLKKVL